MKSFHVTLDLSRLSPASFTKWCDTDIADGSINPRGIDGNDRDVWWVRARDQKSAMAKAEREIGRAQLPITIDTVEERI